MKTIQHKPASAKPDADEGFAKRVNVEMIRLCIRETLLAAGIDPDEPISDAGHTVFDGIVDKVNRSLKAAVAAS